jgi:hypothetical protein
MLLLQRCELCKFGQHRRVVQCIQKVAVLWKVLEVMPTKVCTIKIELNCYTFYRYCTSKLCLTTEYSETTAHFNGNFDTDNQIYVPQPKCTTTFPNARCVFNWRLLWLRPKHVGYVRNKLILGYTYLLCFTDRKTIKTLTFFCRIFQWPIIFTCTK